METLTVKARNPDDVALWSKRITDCKNSGMRPGEWCEENGINVKTYYYWHNKIRKLVSQQTELFEVPAAPGRRDVPSATIRVGNDSFHEASLLRSADCTSLHGAFQ